LDISLYVFYWVGHAFLVDAETFGWLLPVAVIGGPAYIAIYTAIGFALAHLCGYAGRCASWHLPLLLPPPNGCVVRPEELVFGTLRNLQKIAQTEDLKASRERILHMVDRALSWEGELTLDYTGCQSASDRDPRSASTAREIVHFT
jgi:hypothetical protein